MNRITKTVVAAMLAGAAMPAAAAVFSEDFNNAGFVGGSPFVDTSDRFGPTTYFTALAFDGWSFSGGNTFLAQSVQGDGAILLNENGGGGVASRTISGLTAGNSYALSFLLSGDNRPGSAYVLNVSVDGAPAVVFNGVDGTSGSVPGVLSNSQLHRIGHDGVAGVRSGLVDRGFADDRQHHRQRRGSRSVDLAPDDRRFRHGRCRRPPPQGRGRHLSLRE